MTLGQRRFRLARALVLSRQAITFGHNSVFPAPGFLPNIHPPHLQNYIHETHPEHESAPDVLDTWYSLHV